MSKDKEEKDFLEAEEKVNVGLYKLLRSFCADSENIRYRFMVGQTIASLHRYVEKHNLFSNVTAEDLDDWFREELNFSRDITRKHEEENEKEESKT